MPLACAWLFIALFGYLSHRYGRRHSIGDAYKLYLDGLRYRGLYPAEGEKGNDEYVHRLVGAGETGLALQMYSEIHNATLRETRAAIKDMQQPSAASAVRPSP